MNENSYYDLLIKNARVYDGSPDEPKNADIGINNDRIERIGQLQGKAGRTIDASGMIASPGFIDVHTHCDLTFLPVSGNIEPVLEDASWKGNWNHLYQGVTTVVSGNCGYGFTDASHWLELIDSVGFGSNVYHLAPHGTIRNELFGDDQPGELSAAQLERFKAKIAESMEMGALGMSVGLAYAPGFLAGAEEIIELAKIVRQYDGLYTIHIRNESGRVGDDGLPGVCRSIREAIEIARQAEVPLQISHLKISEPINNMKAAQILEIIEEGRDSGLDITADQYPYDAGSSHLALLVPDNFVDASGIKKQYCTGSGKLEIKKAIEEVFSYMGPEKVLISHYPRDRRCEGKSLLEISEMLNISPADLYVEMVTGGPVPSGIFFMQDENIMRDIATRDYIITGSDGWTVPMGRTSPHPRCYGTMPKKIKEYVLDKKVQSLKAAIRSMTSLPAEKYKLKERGRLAPGFFADIAIMDLDKIQDKATYADPHQYSEGIEYLLVNGVLSIDKGKASGESGGRAIRQK